MKKEHIANKDWSFLKGWYQLRQKDIAKCRAKLMTALGVTTRPGFWHRMNGNVEPTISQVEAIEAIFNEYDVKDCWGKE
jgi:hypothetical protein